MDWKFSSSGAVTAYIGNDVEVSLPLKNEKGKAIFEIKKAKPSDKAFNKLEKIVIPEGYTSIGASTFKDCTQLREIVIPTTIDLIDRQTFMGCTALESITFMGKIDIEADAFCGCTSLTDVYVVNPNSWLDAPAFIKCPDYMVHLHPLSLAVDCIPKKRTVFFSDDEIRNYASMLFKKTKKAVVVSENKNWNIGDELSLRFDKVKNCRYKPSEMYSVKVVDKVTCAEGLMKENCKSLKSVRAPQELLENSLCYGFQENIVIKVIEGPVKPSPSSKYSMIKVEISLKN